VDRVIDRDAAKDELDGFANVDDLLGDLDALVQAGLLEELPGLAGTRFAVRHEDGHDTAA
jgi:hypothetical protein